MKVTTILTFSLATMMSQQVLVSSATASCNNHIPANIAPLLECIRDLKGTYLGEEVKCLRHDLVNQLQLSNLTGQWDNRDTFFNPRQAKVSSTYHNKSNTPCPWTYVADEDVNRYPRYIQNVNCSSTNCYNSEGVADGLCECTKVPYNMPVLRRIIGSGNGHEWKIESVIVNVACVPEF